MIGGRVLFDAQMHELYGLAPDAFRGTTDAWMQLLHPDDCELVRNLNRTIATGRREFHTQFRIVRSDGQVRHVEISAIVLRDSTQRPVRLIGVNWDITDRIRAEQRYQLIADHSSDVLWIIDTDTGRYTYVSPSIVHLRGCSPEDLIGKPLEHGLSPAAVALIHELLPPLLQAFLAGDPAAVTQTHELEQIRTDGSTVWTEIVTTFIRNDRGSVDVLGVTRDISKRHTAEQALLATTERLTHAEQVAGFGHWTLNLDRSTFEGSANASRLYGLPPGRQWPFDHILDLTLPESRSKVADALRTLVAGQSPYDIVYKIRRPDTGAVAVIHSIARHDPSTRTVFGTIQDITEHAESLAALAAAERYYHLLADNMGDVLWVLDTATNRFTYVSPSVERLRGFTAAESLAQSLEQCTTPASMALIREILPARIRAFVAGDPAAVTQTQQIEQYRRDGSTIWIEIVTTLFRNDRGGIDILGVSRDISLRQLANERLRRAEEIAGIGHWSYNSDTSIFEGSAGAARIYGLTGTSWPATDIRILPLPEYRAELDSAFIALVRQGRPYDVTYGIRRVDTGAIVFVRALAQYDLSGPNVFGVIQDITKRRRAEEQLRLQSAALDAAALAIVITDARGCIEWINPAFTTLTGYTAAEALGHDIGKLVQSGRQSGEFYHQLWTTILAGATWHGELVNRHKDGALFPAEQAITPVRDNTGRIAHFIAIAQDIAERRRLQEQVLRSQRLDSVGRLAGGIAHDLNNILAPVLMAPPILREAISDPETREVIDAIETSANRGAAIIRQLLTFSRGGTGGEHRPVQLGHIVRDMVAMIRETFPKNIVTCTEICSELRLVDGDATQLHQVLMNLCVNSRDAMPDGGTLTIALENVDLDAAAVAGHPGAAPGPHVLLGVFDTGNGIEAANLDKIFDPFFTTKEVGKGTGLGLPTTIGLVRTHHGLIQLSSTPGAGTQVRVYLPASATATDSPPEIDPLLPPQAQGELILVVDDEENVRHVTRRLLEHHGYRVITASDGAEGLARFQQHRAAIQLVLTDLLMPIMDGATLVRAINRIAPGTRIVAASGHMSSDDPLLIGPEIVAFLPKPYLRATLLQVVASALATKG
jgi:two-component system, cell cycle sensor histidine kinase and response regulator CckA